MFWGRLRAQAAKDMQAGSQQSRKTARKYGSDFAVSLRQRDSSVYLITQV